MDQMAPAIHSAKEKTLNALHFAGKHIDSAAALIRSAEEMAQRKGELERRSTNHSRLVHLAKRKQRLNRQARLFTKLAELQTLKTKHISRARQCNVSATQLSYCATRHREIAQAKMNEALVHFDEVNQLLRDSQNNNARSITNCMLPSFFEFIADRGTITDQFIELKNRIENM